MFASLRRHLWDRQYLAVYLTGLAVLVFVSLSYLQYATFMFEDFATFYQMSSPSVLDRARYLTAEIYWRPLQENLMGFLVADLNLSAFNAQLAVLLFYFSGLVMYFQSFRLLARFDKK